MSDDINLRITGVEPGDEIAGARRLVIRTTRGDIPMLLHGAAQPDRAVLCVSGAMGGLDGPAHLYARLGLALPRQGIAVARLDYRAPGEFAECLVDAMAALTFLRGIEYRRLATVGHSFGGAVAINAGTIAQGVTAVAAISSQLGGAHMVGELAPRPLLLLHGTADAILSQQSSEAIFARAGDPKRLELIAGADHGFSAHGDRILEIVERWLLENT
ncbi:MAG: dienelactone hydrolase family protein [Candidatus Binataceae bacterium]